MPTSQRRLAAVPPAWPRNRIPLAEGGALRSTHQDWVLNNLVGRHTESQHENEVARKRGSTALSGDPIKRNRRNGASLTEAIPESGPITERSAQ